MPNWAEGTLKIRGKKENVIRFLKEGIIAAPNFKMTEDGPVTVPQKVDISEDDYSTTLYSENEFYINNTRRAFIDRKEIEVWHEECDEALVEILGFKQAWGVIKEDFEGISKKYNIDIKIFVFEMGMEFTQEVEVIEGETTKNIVKEYDDYFWEVPFSSIGG